MKQFVMHESVLYTMLNKTIDDIDRTLYKFRGRRQNLAGQVLVERCKDIDKVLMDNGLELSHKYQEIHKSNKKFLGIN